MTRQEVIADTLIDGDIFAFVKVIGYDAERTDIITQADTTFYYLSVVDGSLLEWSREEGKTELAELFHDFNTCDILSSYDILIVEGAHDTTTTFPSGEAVPIPALKRNVFEGPQIVYTEEYAYGIGFLGFRGEPSTYSDLTYARIAGQEYGQRLEERFDIRVATEEPPAFSEARLTVYPNPASAVTHVAFVLPHSGRTSLHVYDLLGRFVARPLEEIYLPAGSHTERWDVRSMLPGVYVMALLVEGRPIKRGRFVVVR